MFARGVFFDQRVVHFGIGGRDRRGGEGFGDARDEVFPRGDLTRGVEVGVGRAQRRAEGRAVGDFKRVHRAVLHIGHDLEDFGIDRRPASRVNSRGAHGHPFGVQAHRHHLRFDNRATIARRVAFVEVEAMHARIEHIRHDFGFEIGQHDFATIAGGSGLEGARKPVPVQAMRFANRVAGERAIFETQEGHVVARGRHKNVPLAARIGLAIFHRAKVGVAGAERNGDHALADEAEADDAVGIVAGPNEGLRVRIEAVFIDEIPADRPDDGAGCGKRRQAVGQVGGRGVERVGMPCAPPNVHQIHARAIAVIDGGNRACDQRGEKRTDERDVGGIGIGIGARFVKLANLRPRKAFKSRRTRGPCGRLKPAQGIANFIAFGARRGIHPDGRCAAREDAAQILDERLSGIEIGQGMRDAGVEIDGTVLLPRSRECPNAAQVDAVAFHFVEHRVEGFGPHEGRRVNDFGIGIAAHAVLRAVVRQRFVVIHRRVIRDRARVEVDNYRAQALRARVESEIEIAHTRSFVPFYAP